LKFCLLATFLISTALNVAPALADTGGSCSGIKLGNDYIPRNPIELEADPKIRFTNVSVDGVGAFYSSPTELSLNWSRWPVFDQTDETLFYDKYILFRSSDAGVSWQCSTISSALIFFTLSGLPQNTDYKFAISATNGSVWARPTYFSGSTNPTNRPVLTRCIREDFKPKVATQGKITNFLLITSGVSFGDDLPLKWTLSENRWKSSTTYKDTYGQTFIPISSPVILKISGRKGLVQIKVTPFADKTPKIFQSDAYSGITSKGCPSQTYEVDIKKKTMRLVK
jgi:hypothetical protein